MLRYPVSNHALSDCWYGMLRIVGPEDGPGRVDNAIVSLIRTINETKATRPVDLVHSFNIVGGNVLTPCISTIHTFRGLSMLLSFCRHIMRFYVLDACHVTPLLVTLFALHHFPCGCGCILPASRYYAPYMCLLSISGVSCVG